MVKVNQGGNSMKLDPFFDNLTRKRVKLPLEDIDVEWLDKPLEEMSDEQIYDAVEGKTIKVVELGDLEEVIIEGDDKDLEDARSEIFIEFYQHLRVLAVDKDLFPAFARFAKQETLLAGRWRDRFPKRPPAEEKREFCKTLRHRYFTNAEALAICLRRNIEDQIASDPFYQRKGITNSTEFLDELSKKKKCLGEEVDFLLYWHSTSPVKDFGSELQQALDLASKAKSKTGVSYEYLLKAGVKLSESDWDFVSKFFNEFLEGLGSDAEFDQVIRYLEELAFKVAHSRCRAELQDKVLALIVSARGGDVSIFTHLLVCRDAAFDHPTLEDFKEKLPEQWSELSEFFQEEQSI
jgi:hypothetical protein